jgi:GTP 3',8-cyclase
MTLSPVITDHQALTTIQAYSDTTLLSELVALEKRLGEQHIRQMTLHFRTEHTPHQILDRLGYEPLAGQPNHFSKPVHYQRSVRFSITEKCNYHCFFCHEEGMDMQTRRQQADDQHLFQVLDQLAAADYQDFTFTGGEPLLNAKRLLTCLDYMQHIGYCPDITIVSNGVPITDSLLDQLQQYPNALRFNISLHSTDPATYANIVQNQAMPHKPLRDEYTKVQASLEKLKQRNIPFKLNVVLLKDLNTSDAALADLFEFALRSGASHIKFLELMLTSHLKGLYPYFYRLQSVQDRLSKDLTLVDQNYRRRRYRYRDTALLIELQQCTCSRGCNTCAINRATNFTAELKTFPCFLKPEDNVDLTRTSLQEALLIGDTRIEHMAKTYGEHSPIIIRDQPDITEQAYYYYEISATQFETCSQQWANLIYRTHQFEERIFSLESAQPSAPHQHPAGVTINKINRNSYDHFYRTIHQTIHPDPAQPGRFITQFLPPQEQPADVTPEWIMNWDIQYYRLPDSHQEISLSRNTESARCIMRSDRPITLNAITLTPLTQSPTEWLRYKQRIC